jgi:hypothetical protein
MLSYLGERYKPEESFQGAELQHPQHTDFRDMCLKSIFILSPAINSHRSGALGSAYSTSIFHNFNCEKKPRNGLAIVSPELISPQKLGFLAASRGSKHFSLLKANYKSKY